MKLSFHGLFFVVLLGSFSVQAQTKIAPKGRVQPKPRMGMGNPGAEGYMAASDARRDGQAVGF